MCLQQSNLGSYLAGLIEGNGHTMVPLKERNRKKPYYKYCPKISITFPFSEIPLAKKLRDVLDVGRIVRIKGDNVEYNVQNIQGLYKIVNLINGRMRTLKIELLHKLISWLNEKSNLRLKIISKDLDTTEIFSNSWFCGFVEANGFFYLDVFKNNNIRQFSCYFFLEIKESFPEKIQTYLPILKNIAEFLGVELKIIKKLSKKKKEYISFFLTTHVENNDNIKYNIKLFNYFIRYPLLSSKFLNLLEWAKVCDIISTKKNLRPSGISAIVRAINNFKNIEVLRGRVIKGLFVLLPQDQRYIRGYHSRVSIERCNRHNFNFLDWKHLERFFYFE